MSNDKDIIHCFHGKIFVNPDSSFLVQKEEYRLRQKQREMKQKNPEDTFLIRKGILYKSNEPIDKIDFRNQLF